MNRWVKRTALLLLVLSLFVPGSFILGGWQFSTVTEVQADAYSYTNNVSYNVPDGTSTGTGCEIWPATRYFLVNDDFSVNDLNVEFSQYHASRGQIRMTLKAPDGTQRELISTSGNTESNFYITLDDDGSGGIYDGTGDTIGVSRRSVGQVLLTDFEGLDARGHWTMTICDNTFTDGNPSQAFNEATLVFDGTPITPTPLNHQQGPPIQENYYLSWPEDHVWDAFGDIYNSGCSTYSDFRDIYDAAPREPMVSYTGITIIDAGTVITYDHWEDGYESNLTYPSQNTTEVWGDGNLTNGSAPGDADDVFINGQVLVLDDVMLSTTLGTVIDFDARDKIGASKPINVSRSVWADGSQTLFAAADEVYPVDRWGTQYYAPVGEDADLNDMFEFSLVSVIAAVDSTILDVDLDGNGTYETTGISLNEGDVWFSSGGGVDENAGFRSNADHPIQVNLMTGDVCAGYESRTYPMLPYDQWDSSYFLPVSTIQDNSGANSDDGPTTVHIFNPNSAAITVNYDYTTSAGGNFSVPAYSSQYRVIPVGEAAHFYTFGPAGPTSDNVRDEFSSVSYTNNDGSQNWSAGWVDSEDGSPSAGLILISGSQLRFHGVSGTDPTIQRSADLSSFSAIDATLSFDITTSGNLDSADEFEVFISNSSSGPFTSLESFNNDITATRSYDITDYISSDTTVRFQIPSYSLDTGKYWYVDDVDISVSDTAEKGPVFYAIASVDSDVGGTGGTDRNDTYDWGITMVPESVMSQWLVAGWAPGDDPTFEGTGEQNTAPIWLTGGHPLGSSTPSATFDICIDDNGDCTSGTCTLDLTSGRYYDRLVTGIAPLTQMKIFTGVVNPPDTDTTGTPGEDQTGTSIWVCGPTGTDALITAAWGEDPLVANAGKPGVDMGYTLRNQRAWRATKSAELQVDRNGNGLYDIGDTVRYTITVFNTGTSSIPTVNVQDTNDPNVTYVADSTYLTNDGTAPPASGQIADSPSSGDFPLDSSGSGYDYTGFDPGSSFSIRYDATIDLTDPFVETRRNVAIITIEDEIVEPEVTITVRESEELGSIGNYVWLDEDGDGDQDAGEAGIPNVLVTLTNGTETYTTYTDADGGYLFTDLPADTWTVTVSPPAALHQTYDEDGIGTPNVTVVDLFAGEEHLTADFGYNWSSPIDTNDPPTTGALGAIGDRVWVDVDGEGDQDPEEVGIQGIEVQLWYDSDGDGVIDSQYGTSDTTDANGNYLFDDLPAGTYEVRVIDPPWTQTGDPDGTFDDQTGVVLAPGDVFLNADFGYQPDSTGDYGEIGDTVWFDAVPDGDYNTEDNEYGLVGVTVSLIQDTDGDGAWDPDGADNVLGTADDEPIIATDITDESGKYLFTGLPAGDGEDYIVWVNDTEDVLDDLVPTYDDDDQTPPITTPNISWVSDLPTAGNYDQDFGYTAPDHDTGDGLIGDTVFLDVDGDGIWDPDEGLEGVLVRLYASDGVTLLAETTTNEDGLYFFGDLLADADGETYIVQVQTGTLPYPGLSNTVDPDGGFDSTSTVTLTSSSPIDLDQDFGYRDETDPNTIGGTLWEDTNADGTLDTPDEPGRFEGVTVVLRDPNGDIVATTVTDANGDYSFTGLPDGTYTVDVTDDANILNGYWHSDGPNDGLDNNSQDDPYVVTVGPSNRLDTTGDFGYYIEPAALGNFIWYDEDEDGIQDTGEAGMPDVVVTLTITYPNGSIVNVVTTTDSNGNYRFDNLLQDEDYNGDGAGEPTYDLTIEIPEKYLSTLNDEGSDDSSDSDGTGVDGDKVVVGLSPNSALVQGYYNEDYDFGLIINPTSVDILWFRATAAEDKIIVAWETANESDCAGFILYRAENIESDPIQISPSIPALNPDGAIYEFPDTEVDFNVKYYYWLEEYDNANRLKATFGPVSAYLFEPDAPKFFIPIILSGD